MQIESIHITNMRGLESAELKFQPGFNLIVGVNGVGKTTVLDALASVLSNVTKQVNNLSRQPGRELMKNEIRAGTDALTVSCRVDLEGTTYTYLIQEAWDKPSRSEFIGSAPHSVKENAPKGRPMAVFFSARRAGITHREVKTGRAAAGYAAAFFEALEERGIALSELRDWMWARQRLSMERPESGRVLEALNAAAQRFLLGYSNLRVEDPNAVVPQREARTIGLVIDRGQHEVLQVDSNTLTDNERAQIKQVITWVEERMPDWTGEEVGKNPSSEALEASRAAYRASKVQEGLRSFAPFHLRNLRSDENGTPDALIDRLPITLSVGELSEGERGILAIVLDLTRRLAMANPHLKNPAAEVEAIVLIDEIDLHLHPKWQREVIRNLTETFPRCQFIATTHSPQIISEVRREQLQILTPTGVDRPAYSYGVDSSRVLKEIMGAPARPREIEEAIKNIASLAWPETLEQAHIALKRLATKMELGENDPEVVRLKAHLEFMEDDL